MKRSIKILSLCLLAGVCMVVGLYLLTIADQRKNNGFSRKLVQNAFNNPVDLDLHSKYYYIAGVSNAHIYLGNYDTPTHFLAVNLQTLEKKYYTIKTPPGLRYFWNYSRLQVDSPHVYFTEGMTPTLFGGTLQKPDLKPLLKTKDHFRTALVLSDSLIIAKSIDESVKENRFSRFSAHDTGTFLSGKILEKQGEGLFSTDGLLNYDPQTRRLVYVYYYRNTFFTMDTNFKIDYIAHTIDTNSRVKIHVGAVKTEQKITMLSPPLFVNKNCCTDQGFLYIISPLRADNQDFNKFKKLVCIDQYDLKKGNYRQSSEIPLDGWSKCSDFRIKGNYCLLLGDHYLRIIRVRRKSEGKMGYLQPPGNGR
jgi:hypothetical protein